MMKTRWFWLGGFLVAAVVWSASPELGWPARLMIALLLGPLPVLFMLQASLADSFPHPLPRLRVYTGTIAGLWLLGIGALAAAASSGFTARVMGLHLIDIRLLGLWSVFAILGSAAVVVAFKAFGFRDAEIMRDIIPQSARERAVFTVVAISAGIFEELTFRSFLVPALMVASGSLILAVAVSSVAFGLLHAHQRTGGALRASMLGAVLCVPLVMTGSVLPSMIAHTLIDVAGGIWLSRWLMG